MSSRIRELEQQLESVEKQLRLFQRVSRFMVRDIKLSDALRNVVALMVEFLHCESCLLYLLDGDRLVLCASNDPDSTAVGHVSLKLDEGLTGWVARERRLLAISRDAYTDPRFKYFKNLPQDQFEAFLSAPVIWRNRVIGVINVQHRAAHAHTGGELEMITTVGEQIGCMLMLAHATSSDTAAHLVEHVLGTPSRH
ncbi:MAG TPA: GAF domain-containing protein [Bryobacteraceae bacterium]|nr:GAF domain-containing protein [Bryobacteraceae bacterium]